MADRFHFNEDIGIDLLDRYAHFAAKRFKWSLTDIRESWDNNFFACVRIEEDIIKEEEKHYKNQKNGHTGGTNTSNVSKRTTQRVPEPELENDPQMNAIFDELMGDWVD